MNTNPISRRVIVYSMYLLAVAAPLAYASDLTIPNLFTNGQVADADQMNANLMAIKAAIDDNHVRLLAQEQQPVPAFHAYVSGNNLAAVGSLVLDSESLDDGGGYDNTTGVFTAPKSGVYQFAFKTSFISAGIVRMLHNGNRISGTWASDDTDGADDDRTGAMPLVIRLSAGDTIEVELHAINGNANVTLWGTTTHGAFTTFSGHWVGP